MCLFTTQTEPKTAETDLVVYKIFGHTFNESGVFIEPNSLSDIRPESKKYVVALIQDFTYFFNTLYETEMTCCTPSSELDVILFDRKSWGHARQLTEHLDSSKGNYGDPIYIKAFFALQQYPDKFKLITTGFHSIESIERIKYSSRKNIYKCVIPAGAEYYSDGNGLMVSNKIIVTTERIAY